jgi:SH3-like domain-containing protein
VVANGLGPLAAAFLVAATTANSGEFRSVAEPAAVLYDAPSRASVPLFVVSRAYPLELVALTDAWVKVRDHTGAMSWVERKLLSERRTVVVTAARAEVRARADDAAAVSFSVAQNGVLDLVEHAGPNWLRVRHAEGGTGFVRVNLVWGN